jgi:hypothetical protein
MTNANSLVTLIFQTLPHMQKDHTKNKQTKSIGINTQQDTPALFVIDAYVPLS